MTNTLQDKVAIVTGGGQGIGRGISLALADEGAAVAVVGRTEAKLKDTVVEIERRGGRAIAVAADVTDPDAIDRAVSTTVDELGGLDILVNNAQDFCFGSLLEIDPNLVMAGLASGPLATLGFMRRAHDHLVDGGCIVNLSSSAVLDAPAGVGVYSAAKAAIQSLSRAAAVEWGAEGIRVNTVMPFARTPATQAAFDSFPGHEEQIVSHVPLGRVGDPEADIGRVVAFLCGPDASFITGTTIAADGGMAFLR